MISYSSQDISVSDIEQAVHIQLQELPAGFLSSLGKRPLALIFQHAAESKEGILVLAKEEDKVIGYVMGTLDTSAFYLDFLRRRLWVAVRYFLPRLLSFSRFRKALETLIYPARKSQEGVKMIKAELLDLAVRREYHGKGVARELFQHLVAEFQRLGIGEFQIPTTEGLARAHRFYEKMGARLLGSVEVHQGQKTLIYQYKISDEETL